MPYFLLLVLSFATGAYADITYGGWAGWWGFAAGFVAALMIGYVIVSVAARRDRRRSGL